MIEDVEALLATYQEVFPEEEVRVSKISKLIHWQAKLHGEVLRDSNCVLHLTASGICPSDDGCRIVMVYHSIFGRLIQPGGHLERGETLASSAIREFKEETGIEANLSPWFTKLGSPLDIDVHRVRCGEKTVTHCDFRFLFSPFGDRLSSGSPAQFISVKYILNEPTFCGLRRALNKAVNFGFLNCS